MHVHTTQNKLYINTATIQWETFDKSKWIDQTLANQHTPYKHLHKHNVKQFIKVYYIKSVEDLSKFPFVKVFLLYGTQLAS